MNEDEVKKIIFESLKKIAPETEPEKLKPNENLRQALDIDSFDGLQFIVSLKKNLGIEIPEADYGKTATLTDLLSYIKENLKSKSID